jgi:drug/metabolite transporter (DMT)-like permease
MIIAGQSFTFQNMFHYADYLILIFGSFMGMMGLLSKAKALKNEKAGSLSIMTYIQLVVMMLFDFFLFNLIFKASDFIGISIILVSNVFAGFYVLKQS